VMGRSIDGGNEIGDACNNTVDRVNGYLVQAYWSNHYRACIIPKRFRRVEIEFPESDTTEHQEDPQKATVKPPAPACPPGTYTYWTIDIQTHDRFEAIARGFDNPVFTWFIADQAVNDGTSGEVSMMVDSRWPGPLGEAAGGTTAVVQYNVSGNFLEVYTRAEDGNYDLPVRVAVQEIHDPGNQLGGASGSTSDFIVGREIRWEQQYWNDAAACMIRYLEYANQIVKKIVRDKGDPIPPWVDQLPSWLSQEARGDLRNIAHVAHYASGVDPIIGAQLRDAAGRVFSVPPTSLMSAHNRPSGKVEVTKR
jgi:hypothetical protein